MDDAHHVGALSGQGAGPMLSVVIPVYQSAKTLPALMQRLVRVLEAMAVSYEVVFVDDGSPDDSWAVLQELQVADPRHVTIVQLMRNFGQHNALMCGFRYARGRYVLTMDDDLQNPPEEIPKLVDAIRAGSFDVVYGAPLRRRQHSGRRAGSAMVRWFYRRVFKSDVHIGPFRVIDRDVLQNILRYDLNFTFIDGLLAWHTERIGSVEVEHHPRESGRSGYRFGKLVTLTFNLFTNFSLLPLQIVSGTGFLFAFAGLLGSCYYLFHYFTGAIAVPGYGSTIVAILVLGGVQLLSLGLIGEYLGRVHLNLNRKPQYVVRTINSAENAEARGQESHERGRVPSAGGTSRRGRLMQRGDQKPLRKAA